MQQRITAREIIRRIKDQSGAGWKDSASDTFGAGDPDTVVTGIAASFTPSIDVLQRSVALGKNLLITQQPVFYGQTEAYLKNDPAYIFKKDLIGKNNLVIWRYDDNWNDRDVDGQLLGLARALGWDKYHIAGPDAEKPPYAKENKYFRLPESSLKEKAAEIKRALKIPALRIIGDPDTRIKKAALSHGMFRLAELQEFLKDPAVDLVLIAEAIEWESCEYFRDLLTWEGNNKGMILIGREASEDPGYREVASWLKTFIPEVPVEWIPAGEPFWIP